MEQKTIPHVVVDYKEYMSLVERLEKIDEKIEFVHAELAQRYGKKVGRDIGILYGLTVGILMFLIFIMVRATFV